VDLYGSVVLLSKNHEGRLFGNRCGRLTALLKFLLLPRWAGWIIPIAIRKMYKRDQKFSRPANRFFVF